MMRFGELARLDEVRAVSKGEVSKVAEGPSGELWWSSDDWTRLWRHKGSPRVEVRARVPRNLQTKASPQI